MVLKSILVVYDRCTGCGAPNCIVASYPDTVYDIPTLERITRKACSKCKGELQIKRMKAKVNRGAHHVFI